MLYELTETNDQENGSIKCQTFEKKEKKSQLTES
jgi:hypothetical protein